jgi:hypothetical protein
MNVDGSGLEIVGEWEASKLERLPANLRQWVARQILPMELK